MASDNQYNNKIFSLNRLKFEELYNDALGFVRRAYSSAKQTFNSASPFSQLLSVILHLGRMIFYYIEDSISGLNIKTAYREDQIKGLATLTGHVPGRAISARGIVKLSYYNTGVSDYSGQVCFIPNKTSIINKLNGRSYVLLFSADVAKMTFVASNYLEASVIEGTVKTQQGTCTGLPLQSFNFVERNYGEIDQYFVNVYVNGERWDIVDSLIDLSYNQKGVIVKTGMLGGIDVFFGNGSNGLIPDKGAICKVEYIVTSGFYGNIPKNVMNSDDYWQFKDSGYLSDGTEVDLNKYVKISSTSDIIFGNDPEDIQLTQRIAPYSSRSMVLANATNYKYFFKKMNMFSIIEVINGFNTYSDSTASVNYDSAYSKYQQINNNYLAAVQQFGEDSTQTESALIDLNIAEEGLHEAEQSLADSELDDNTIYLLLIPDIKKRISSNTNYFNTDIDNFLLSDDEKASLLGLIEESQQRVITIENKIIDPKCPKFAVNASIKMWDTYKFEDVYNSCLNALSEYLLSIDRRDMIPISDIVALFENVNGVDSVTASFEASKDNESIYGKTGYYGIDDFGDISLIREVTDSTGATVEVRDIYPLFRGNFTGVNGTYYSDSQSMTEQSAFNLTLKGYSSNKTLNIEKSTVMI